jgi:nitrite reductase (NADH) small subunit
MPHFVPVASFDELNETQGKAVRVNNLLIALFKLTSGQVYAVENSCPHIGAPLDNGLIEDKNIICLWHGWSFSLESGISSNCPGVSIKTYPTKVQDGQVFIEIN